MGEKRWAGGKGAGSSRGTGQDTVAGARGEMGPHSCSLPRRAGPEQHMPSSCHQPKPLEGRCTGKQTPSCWRQCLQQSCPASPSSDTRCAQGLVLAAGRSSRAGPQAGRSLQGSSAPHCLSSWGAAMSHLVGSHLQSLLLKQFHSLGGWKTGHQLQVSEEGALPPHPPRDWGSWGPRRRRERRKQSHYKARPGSAVFCTLSPGSPGSLSARQDEGRGLPAHLDGCVGVPKHLPAADAAVDAAHGHEQAEGEEVAVVVVSHAVV